MSDDAAEQRPLLRLISADATQEEVAAVLVVVLARSGGDPEPAPAQTSAWADPSARHRGVRGAFNPGRDGWRTSSWPR